MADRYGFVHSHAPSAPKSHPENISLYPSLHSPDPYPSYQNSIHPPASQFQSSTLPRHVFPVPSPLAPTGSGRFNVPSSNNHTNIPTCNRTGYRTTYYWVDTFTRGHFPSTAIHGGVDSDGSPIYVGRAYHEGDWLPAKVIPSKEAAYIAYGGEEHFKDQYQVLCEQRFDWVDAFGSNIPNGAVEGGRTIDGEPLYIGRAHHEGSHTVGKVQPSHGVCYIPYGGRELAYNNFQVLVLRY